MHLRYIGQVEVDQCPECQGVFLDRGELRALRGGVERSSFELSDDGDEGFIIYTPEGLSDHLKQ